MTQNSEDKTAKLQQQLEALEDALFEGVLEVEYDDKRVKYRSFREMQNTIDMIKKRLGQSKKTCRIYADYSKGVC